MNFSKTKWNWNTTERFTSLNSHSVGHFPLWMTAQRLGFLCVDQFQFCFSYLGCHRPHHDGCVVWNIETTNNRREYLFLFSPERKLPQNIQTFGKYFPSLASIGRVSTIQITRSNRTTNINFHCANHTFQCILAATIMASNGIDVRQFGGCEQKSTLTTRRPIKTA